MSASCCKPAPASSVPMAPGACVPGATSQAQSGEPYIQTPTPYDAVLLLGFGGPESQDDVLPFLRNVTQGRGIPDERLEEVAHHYRHFGGVSPINAQNRELAAALSAELVTRGRQQPVYGGNRNWSPYVSDALRRAWADGHRRILALTTSAYSSYSSCRQYREDLADALEETDLGDELQIDKVRQFFDHPGFIAPFVDGIRTGLNRIAQSPGAIDVDTEALVVFSTHSIPLADAQRSGPPETREGPGGAYEAQHRAVAEAIMRQAAPTVAWRLAYQSRSGPPTVPWLEPDINDALEECAQAGTKAVLIVPLGFVSDHMEVMWDLDTEAMGTASRLGLLAERTPTPGTHPAYVSGLVDLIEERLEGISVKDRPHETALGPWFDVCRPGCCENVRRGFRPALAGIQP